jgi:hypothetical protein
MSSFVFKQFTAPHLLKATIILLEAKINKLQSQKINLDDCLDYTKISMINKKIGFARSQILEHREEIELFPFKDRKAKILK